MGLTVHLANTIASGYWYGICLAYVPPQIDMQARTSHTFYACDVLHVNVTKVDLDCGAPKLICVIACVL